MKNVSLCLALAVSFSTPALGQASDPCAQFQDQIVSPVSFEEVADKFAGVPKLKDEFETTEAFRTRQSAFVDGVPKSFVIRKEADKGYIKYDADSQKMRIETYLFDNVNFSMSDVLRPGSSVLYSMLANIDVVISEKETPVGSYEGSNSFGAKAKIIKVKRTIKAIFDRAAAGLSSSLFDNAGKSTLIEFSAPPAGAKFIKDNIQVAFRVEPFSPYVLTGTGRAGAPSISRPIDIETNTTVLFADIQCAFLIDSSNKVLASIPTH